MAESIYWDERGFIRDMRRAPVRYRLDKARAARAINRLRIQPLLRGLAILVITSLSIQVTTLPLMAYYFNRVTPVAVLLNIAAGGCTGLLMLAAIATLATATISTWAAAQLEWVVIAAHYCLVDAVAPFLNAPLASLRVAHYEGWPSIIYASHFVGIAMLALLIDLWRPVDSRLEVRAEKEGSGKPPAALARAALFVCGLALIASLIALVRPAASQASGRLKIHFLDVGQGDSALVIFPEGATMLIDAGGEIESDRARDSLEKENAGETKQSADRGREEIYGEFRDSRARIGEMVVSRFLWSQGLTRLDYVLASHADADHIGGLTDVARNFSIGQAILARAPADKSEFARFEGALSERGVPVGTIKAGERFELQGVRIEVLWPAPAQGVIASGNNDSVVVRLVYGKVAVLFTGDIERETEERLLRARNNLRADVLKVPHHGSKTSSSETFIEAVEPRYAVISVGERSRFGHPHTEVVNRYLDRRAEVLQTGRDGMLTVETDGVALEVKSSAK